MAVEMCTIVHDTYDKISDICYWLTPEYVVKFNVELNRKTDKYGRLNYHREIGYFNDGEFRVNINREFNYYLTIESIRRGIDGSKLQLRISNYDLFYFQYLLNQAAQWFLSDKNNQLFVIKDNRIIMIEKPEPIRIEISFGAYIELEPSILNVGLTDQTPGVRMYLNSDGLSIFMPTARFLSFVYFISNFNMYQSAQLMVNYLGRPENGYNLYAPDITIQSKSNQKIGFLDRVGAKKIE